MLKCSRSVARSFTLCSKPQVFNYIRVQHPSAFAGRGEYSSKASVRRRLISVTARLFTLKQLGSKCLSKSPSTERTRLKATYACPCWNDCFALQLKSTTTLSTVRPWDICIVKPQAKATGNCSL